MTEACFDAENAVRKVCDQNRRMALRIAADARKIEAYEGAAKDPGGPEALGLAVTCGCLRGELRTAEHLLREAVRWGLFPAPDYPNNPSQEIRDFLSRGGVAPPVVIRAETQSVGKDAICEVCDGGPGNDGVCACPKG